MTDKILIDRAVVERVLDALCNTESVTGEQCEVEYHAIRALRAALEQPQVEQEPYVWYDIDTGDTWTVGAIADGCPAPDGIIPLYNNPQPSRQPLTEEEIRDLFQNQRAFSRLLKFIRVIEAFHGIKEQK